MLNNNTEIVFKYKQHSLTAIMWSLYQLVTYSYMI